MQTFSEISPLRHFLADCRRHDKRVGLVPTMGNLHDGHLRLVKEASNRCDVVITTIFVNPMQFGANEDLDQYPRTPEADQAKLVDAGCDLLFMPAAEIIYPDGMGNQTTVHVPGLSELHCGASRPGHFDGVATVVSKLFNIIPADMAFFGEKDFQQLQLIRKLARDLCFTTRIVGVPTVRETDGLALSSRNGYLDAAQRAEAPRLYATLQSMAGAVKKGDRKFRALEQSMQASLESATMRVDYLAVCNADSLLPAAANDERLVILGAVYLGSTRLIDNIQLDAPDNPD